MPQFFRSPAGLPVLVLSFLACGAQAAAVDVALEFQQDVVGDASASFFVFKNGNLLAPEAQIVQLDLGDTLRLEIESGATGLPDVGNFALGGILAFVQLSDATTGAQLMTSYSARVDARGVDAIGSGSYLYSCFGVPGCEANDIVLFNTYAIISDTVAGNGEIIDDEFFELPGFGGVLEQTVDIAFDLLPTPMQEVPLLNLALAGDADVFDNSGTAAAAFVTLEITVVPVPAAAWVFGSALGLLAWARRRA